jgi:hypothetical protein
MQNASQRVAVKSGAITLLFAAFLGLSPAHAAVSAPNGLPGYLAQRGAVIVPYTHDAYGEMNADAMLCSQKTCVRAPVEFDTGDPDNNISGGLKEKLGLTREKKLVKFRLGTLPPISGFPIYFSPENARGDYIGARWIEKLGLWFNFGSREVYGKVPRHAVPAFMKRSALRYEAVPLKRSGPYRYITVSINGEKPVNFLIDTGATASVIDTEYALSLGLRFNTGNCTAMESQIGETRTCFTRDVASMKAGKTPLSVALPKGFANLYLGFVIPNVGISGILGLDWLENNAAVMSLAENKLYVAASPGDGAGGLF